MIAHGVAYLLMVALNQGPSQALADRIVLAGATASRLGILLHPLGLMAVHGVAYVLTLALGQALAHRFVLSGDTPSRLGILLHPLGTSRLMTALFVILALWSLGGRLEARLGPRHLVALYLVCNAAAGALYLAVARGLPMLAAMPLDYPTGALAGFCVVAGLRLRNEAMQVLGRVTSVAKVYAICGVIVIALAVAEARLGAVAWLAAVIAGGLGALLVEFWPALVRPRPYAVRRVPRPSVPRPSARAVVLEEPDIDDILAKISRHGLQSLTDADRRRLEAARQAKLRK